MEMERTSVNYAKRIVELEAQRDQLREENLKLKAREERIKERFDSEERKWREEEDEIRAKCLKTEMEKRKLEIDLMLAVRRTDDGDKLKAAEAEAASLKRLLEERAMEAEKQLKLEEDTISELTQTIKILEGEKRKLGDALSQAKWASTSQIEKIERIWNESEKKVLEMADRIKVLNMEKKEMAEEIKRILIEKAEREKLNSEHENINVGISWTPTPPKQGFVIKRGNLKAGARKLSVTKGGGMTAKHKNKPKRPLTAFFVFMKEFRKTFSEKDPESPDNNSIVAQSKAGSAEWKMMSEADKAPYMEEAVKRKKEYEKRMAAYKKQDGGGDAAEEEFDKSTSEVHDEDEDDSDYYVEEGSDEDDLQLGGHNNGEALGWEHQKRKVEDLGLGCTVTVASEVGIKRNKSGLEWTTPEKIC